MIALIKGCGNNIASLQYALQRIGVEFVLTDASDVIRAASHVILPGVGQGATVMAALRQAGLDQLIPTLTVPVLGICVGMQVLYESTEEGNVKGLGVLAGRVKKMLSTDQAPIPHMGWNDVYTEHENVGQLYFVHSYAAAVSAHTLAKCDYHGEFSAMVQYQNFMGMQFHPEKSGRVGEQLLRLFLKSGCER